ncbi:hypothetical protein [Leptospira sp. 'Mane']|uniref:hypothetical protein n=1 Tax=Leptospira sp. 'Mane' TaxID=3387407 RepID=UPI00398BA201
MADPDSKKPAPKKKTTDNKKTIPSEPIVKQETPHRKTNQSTLIYNDPKFLKPIPPVEKDLVKVLVRNPREAFVFWNFDPKTIGSLPKELGAPSLDQIHFKLRIQYSKETIAKEDWYDLSAFTSSYYCKWDSPVNEIDASVFAFFGDRSFFCLEAKTGNLPGAFESFQLDEKWIHPNWIEWGWVKQSPSGHFVFSEDYFSTEPLQFSTTSEVFGGSSGFGSHSHIIQ